MAWAMSSGGLGMSRSMDGPVDFTFAFASYLLPLAILELYMRACDSRSVAFKLGGAAVMLMATLATALGVFGAWVMMWSPHI